MNWFKIIHPKTGDAAGIVCPSLRCITTYNPEELDELSDPYSATDRKCAYCGRSISEDLNQDKIKQEAA